VSTAILLKLPCGHQVDLLGTGAPPDVDDPWFGFADSYVTQEEVDGHIALSKWTVYDGRAVAESVTFMHGGSDGDPLLHAVAIYRGHAELEGWTMYLDESGVAP
jgi:hypothetical protein